MVFWQSARTSKQARPGVRVPTARASGYELEVMVNTRERYAWKFAEQQATTTKRALPVGDYAVEDDNRMVAVVERKSVDDLVSTIVGGKLWMLLAELSAFATESGRVAAIVVKDRYSAIFKLRHVRPASIATQLAEAAVRYPTIPIVFAETRSSRRSGRSGSSAPPSSTQRTNVSERNAPLISCRPERSRTEHHRLPRCVPGPLRRGWP